LLRSPLQRRPAKTEFLLSLIWLAQTRTIEPILLNVSCEEGRHECIESLAVDGSSK
jgi:hypothetical protein